MGGRCGAARKKRKSPHLTREKTGEPRGTRARPAAQLLSPTLPPPAGGKRRGAPISAYLEVLRALCVKTQREPLCVVAEEEREKMGSEEADADSHSFFCRVVAPAP